MDTVPRRRRGAPVSDELDVEAAAHEPDYQTALSQASGAGGLPGSGSGGDASPGTLESGGAPGLVTAHQLPVANPFHSDKVKSEVQLLRNRPASLDEDAARLRGEVDEAALGDASWTGGVEPDYSALLGPAGEGVPELRGPVDGTAQVFSGPVGGVAGEQSGSIDESSVRGQMYGGRPEPTPRVARVEASSEQAGRPDLRGEPWKSGKGQGAPAVVVAEGMGLRGEDAGRIVEEPEAVGADDPRELIPAGGDRLSRVEALLGRVLEENQALRRQIQTESSSSWHSARTPGDLPASPMSFGYGHHFPGVMPSTSFSVQTVEQNFSGEFPEGYGRVQGGWNATLDPFPGNPHSLVRARRPAVQASRTPRR